jgi:hypothetical protein
MEAGDQSLGDRFGHSSEPKTPTEDHHAVADQFAALNGVIEAIVKKYDKSSEEQKTQGEKQFCLDRWVAIGIALYTFF